MKVCSSRRQEADRIVESRTDYEKLKEGPGVSYSPSARTISTKNKHLLPAHAANPRFHGGSFGVWRHTSSSSL